MGTSEDEGMNKGLVIGGIIMIVVGVILVFSILCFPVGIVLGIVGVVLLIIGAVSSDAPKVVVQQYPPPYQQPYNQPPQYPQPYAQPQYQQQYPQQYQQQYPPQELPQYQQADSLPPPMAEPQPMSDVELVICPNCGEGNLPEVTFCGHCGQNIKEQVPPTQ
jgi:hypothetical protein